MHKINLDNTNTTNIIGSKPNQKTLKDQAVVVPTFQMALEDSVKKRVPLDEVDSECINRQEMNHSQQVNVLPQVEQPHIVDSQPNKEKKESKLDSSQFGLPSKPANLPKNTLSHTIDSKQTDTVIQKEFTQAIHTATDAELLKLNEQTNILAGTKLSDAKSKSSPNTYNQFSLDQSFESSELLPKESISQKPEIKSASNIDIKSIDLSRLISDLKNMVSKESEKVEVGDKKELKITVRPSVLGEIKIEMAKSHDGIKMLIVASNDNVSNLLSQYRDEIVDAAEKGMSSGGNGQSENNSSDDHRNQPKRYSPDESHEDLITPELTITQHFTY